MKTLQPCTLIGIGHKARQGKNVAAEAMREMAPSDVQLYALADELKTEVLAGFSNPDWAYWDAVDTTGHHQIQNFIKRFAFKDCGCWEWTGAVVNNDYGVVTTLEHPKHRAHRFMWTRILRLPEPEVLLHLCDNPCCVNPLHLKPGTQDENIKDAAAKGRIGNGERHGNATLTDHEVKQIRNMFSLGVKQADIARALEITPQLVNKIVHNLRRVKDTRPLSSPPLCISFSKDWLSNDNKYRFGNLLQHVGTEFWRKKNPNHWIELLQARIERESPAIAIITDVRFPNEARFVKDNGGALIEIIRRTKDGSQYLDPGRDPNHASETALDDYNGWDFILTCKDGDLAGLRLKAKHAFQVIMETQELYEHPEKYEPPLYELGGKQ